MVTLVKQKQTVRDTLLVVDRPSIVGLDSQILNRAYNPRAIMGNKVVTQAHRNKMVAWLQHIRAKAVLVVPPWQHSELPGDVDIPRGMPF